MSDYADKIITEILNDIHLRQIVKEIEEEGNGEYIKPQVKARLFDHL